MYKANIGNQEFELIPGKESSVNGTLKSTSFTQTEKGSYLLTVNGVSKIADLVKLDKENKMVVVRIEGKKYNVNLKEPVDQLLEKLGINIKHGKKLNNLKAPMPGLILKVVAEKGKSYKAGEPLLILEAMKMENVLIVMC